MSYPLTRILAVVVLVALVATGFTASRKPTLTERIDYALDDLRTVQSDIPQQQLHARALEILRSMTVAKDEASLTEKNQ